MSTVVDNVAGSMVANAMAASQTKETADAQKKSRVLGKTIGEPQLSEKASKYYEELKKKYSNMDFILVSKDMKEQAQAQAGKYANANKMVVLIDEEKIEKMAEDEKFREKYEGIIRTAASGLTQMKSSLASTSANVKTYGIKVNDNGTASFFAVIDKSLAAQKDRIAKKAQDKKDAKKAEEKKEAKKAEQERLQEGRTDKSGKADDDTVTITASSMEELVRKINDYMYDGMMANARTEEEKKVGQNFDFSM